ncbi:MAG: rhomboid family intramembrane serine protease [Spirochaetaceae bacterium]|jgi:membrane associated rhomboid family serine protease|nr:rhomboid family intramembrane serine protease [Spirochaetaceae bacterium]
MSLIRKPFAYSYFNVTFILIGINVLFFALQNIAPVITYALAMTPALVLRGCIWQLVTYMFAHAGFSHIIFNMIALFVFGTQTERYMGSKEFLVYYLTTGVLAGFFSFIVFLFTGSAHTPLLGASGAIFAVQLAYAAFFPDSVLYIWGILPLRAPVMALVFTAIEVFSMIFGVSNGVSHLTHLAGFGFGWLYFLARFRLNPLRMMLGRR